MISSKNHHAAPTVRRALLIAIISGSPFAAMAQAPVDTVAVEARAQAMTHWHDTLIAQGPPSTGCYRASFPSYAWTAEACAPPPKRMFPSGHRATRDTRAGQVTQAAVQPLDAGNGVDYAAQTTGLTRSAVGSFPTVSGVDSGGSQTYTLQMNTTSASNPGACTQYGFSTCETWQQFIYDTNDGSATGIGIYMQDWFYVGSASEYKSKGCPDGWGAYAEQQACYRNSKEVALAYVPLSSLGSVRLAGAANQNGKDVVTFTVNGTVHAVSQPASTLNIGKIWKETEFNVIGGTPPAVAFNSGSHVNVRLDVVDGTTNAPACLANAGTTAETNNLNLGPCTAAGGTSPNIQFSESN